MVWRSVVKCGEVWRSVVRFGVVWRGVVWRDVVWRGGVWRGVARCGWWRLLRVVERGMALLPPPTYSLSLWASG